MRARAGNVCFISYSHEDRDFVDFLEWMLALYGDRFEVLRDRGGVARSASLESELKAMVSRSDTFLAVVSPGYAASAWCQRELEWQQSLRPTATVLPLRLDDQVDQFPDRLGIDVSAWAQRGDRIVREELVPLVLGQVPEVPGWSLRLTADAGLQLARDFATLGSAVNRADLRAPADEAFTQIGVRLLQQEQMPAVARALIAAALAGQQIQRGRWAALRTWSTVALAAITEDGRDDRARSDRELAFVGERYTELALAERRLGRDQEAARHYEAAAERYGALTDAVLARVRQGQVAREQGTLAIARLRLDEARECYRRSRSLLAGLPSERMHVAQAWIKESQVELVAGRLDDAHRCLREAAVLVEATEPSELTTRVAAHYWKTAAWLALAEGNAPTLDDSIAAHAEVIAAYAWRNEHAQQRWLRRGRRVTPLLPRLVTRTLARAVVVAEAGARARVGRWLRERFGRSRRSEDDQ